MPRAVGPDTIKILIATDSHVGYKERDPVRKDDSWRSFDEVMRLAKTEDVDMVLLAGDLFHENQPSRKSMFQVMKSLRKNCLGEKPCELEMLSDPSDVLNGDSVNYEDPDINVAIPVFSIHGNHDDPTGEGNFCALDLLQVSGLLNYIGRMPESDNIDVKPVLLQKGQTKLALYGMSNVRDERLFRTFKDGKVKFFTPGVQQKEWYNIMAVHQNHHAHSETGYLPENFLPDFMDLVVWGHEHECLIDPKFNEEMQFQVMQPGSSIATSLVAGEAVAKHVAIAYITGKSLETENIRIKSVRPFVTKDIVLADDPRFEGLAHLPDNRTKITAILLDIVNDLIDEANTEWEHIQDPDDMPDEVPLPLVRLRVDYGAPEGGKFDCENPQRFSNRFVGRVANAEDVVAFHMKKRNTRTKKTTQDMPDDKKLAEIAASDNIKVEKYVREFLEAQSLKILPGTGFGEAVDLYVVKNDKHAMEQFVDDSLVQQVKEMLKMDENDVDEDDLEPLMEQLRRQQEEGFAKGLRKVAKTRKEGLKPRPSMWDSDIDGEWEDAPEAYSADEAPTTGRQKRIGAASDDDDASVMSDAAPAKKVPAKKAAPKRAPAKPRAPAKAKAPAKKVPAKTPARGKKKAAEVSDEEDEDVVMVDDSPPPMKAQPRRAAAAKGRQSQLNFSQAPKSAPPVEISDDEISDDDDAFQPAKPSSSTSRRR